MSDANQKSSHPHWAQRVDELKAPDAPPEALNLNVAGRRAVGPLQGFGQLWQKTFRIRLEARPWPRPR